MSDTALHQRLIYFAGNLIVSGRLRAKQVRTAPPEAIHGHLERLEDIEYVLADFYLHLQAGDDLPADEAPLDLTRHAAAGETPRSVARRWAELACRGHYIEDPPGLGPRHPLDRHREYADVLAAVGIDEERYRWAPGLTWDEAERVYAAAGFRPPEPLADIDDLMLQAHQQSKA